MARVQAQRALLLGAGRLAGAGGTQGVGAWAKPGAAVIMEVPTAPPCAAAGPLRDAGACAVEVRLGDGGADADRHRRDRAVRDAQRAPRGGGGAAGRAGRRGPPFFSLVKLPLRVCRPGMPLRVRGASCASQPCRSRRRWRLDACGEAAACGNARTFASTGVNSTSLQRALCRVPACAARRSRSGRGAGRRCRRQRRRP